jgi:hypothetical protein
MIRRFVAAAAFAVFALPAFSDCQAPSAAPQLPDGATASEADMLAGQAAVKDFVAETEEFLNCLDGAREALAKNKDMKPDLAAEEAALLKYNAAVDAMQRVADGFNEEIRAYRAQNQ